MRSIQILCVMFLIFSRLVIAGDDESTAGWSIQFNTPVNNSTIYLLGASTKSQNASWIINTGGSSQYRVRYYVNNEQRYYGTNNNYSVSFGQGAHSLLIKLFVYTSSGSEIFVTEHSVILNVHPGYKLWVNNNFAQGSVLIDGESKYLPTAFNGENNYRYVTPGYHTLTGIDNQLGSDGFRRIWNEWRDENAYITNNISMSVNVTQNNQGYTAYYNEQPKAPQNLTVSLSPSPSFNPKIEWARNSDWFVVAYKVYRNGVEIATVAQTGNSNSNPYYIDPEITWSGSNTGNLHYTYLLTAVSSEQIQSPPSNAITISTFQNIQKRGETIVQHTPTEFSIKQNYPNPFNPETTIEFSIAKPTLVTLEVFNSAGQRVSQLVNEHKSVGNYSVSWDASNQPSGVYIYKIVAGEFTSQKKMLFIK